MNFNLIIRPGTVSTGVVDEEGNILEKEPEIEMKFEEVDTQMASRIDKVLSLNSSDISSPEDEELKPKKAFHGMLKEKFRIGNATDAKILTVSIAPSEGVDASWLSSDGASIPFNDSKKAQLIISSEDASVEGVHGSQNESAVLSNTAAFNKGEVDSITLLSTSSEFSEYDIQDVQFIQTLPEEAPIKDYQLELMITIL